MPATGAMDPRAGAAGMREPSWTAGERLDELDWEAIGTALDAPGWALVPNYMADQ